MACTPVSAQSQSQFENSPNQDKNKSSEQSHIAVCKCRSIAALQLQLHVSVWLIETLDLSRIFKIGPSVNLILVIHASEHPATHLCLALDFGFEQFCDSQCKFFL